jgi:hypothetical protein
MNALAGLGIILYECQGRRTWTASGEGIDVWLLHPDHPIAVIATAAVRATPRARRIFNR